MVNWSLYFSLRIRTMLPLPWWESFAGHRSFSLSISPPFQDRIVEIRDDPSSPFLLPPDFREEIQAKRTLRFRPACINRVLSVRAQKTKKWPAPWVPGNFFTSIQKRYVETASDEPYRLLQTTGERQRVMSRIGYYKLRERAGKIARE